MKFRKNNLSLLSVYARCKLSQELKLWSPCNCFQCTCNEKTLCVNIYRKTNIYWYMYIKRSIWQVTKDINYLLTSWFIYWELQIFHHHTSWIDRIVLIKKQKKFSIDLNVGNWKTMSMSSIENSVQCVLLFYCRGGCGVRSCPCWSGPESILPGWEIHASPRVTPGCQVDPTQVPIPPDPRKLVPRPMETLGGHHIP